MQRDWVDAFIQNTRPSLHSTRAETESTTEFFQSLVAQAIDPELKANVVVSTVRSPVLDIARVNRGADNHIIFDLSVLSVFDVLNRLSNSGMSVASVIRRISPMIANRFALHGRRLEAVAATEIAAREGHRLPPFLDHSDSLAHHEIAIFQGIFSLMHEVGHCRDLNSGDAVATATPGLVEWWSALLHAYEGSVEWTLSSTSFAWTDSVTEDARGVDSQAALQAFSEIAKNRHRASAGSDLLCFKPISDVVAWVLQNPDTALSEEIFCDAFAIERVITQFSLTGATVADRIVACINAARNLLQLRTMDDLALKFQRPTVENSALLSDTLVRSRLMTLLGQALIRAYAVQLGGYPLSDEAAAHLETVLLATDGAHAGHERIATAIDLWALHHGEDMDNLRKSPEIIAKSELSDLIRRVDRWTNLTNPRVRLDLSRREQDSPQNPDEPKLVGLGNPVLARSGSYRKDVPSLATLGEFSQLTDMAFRFAAEALVEAGTFRPFAIALMADVPGEFAIFETEIDGMTDELIADILNRIRGSNLDILVSARVFNAIVGDDHLDAIGILLEHIDGATLSAAIPYSRTPTGSLHFETIQTGVGANEIWHTGG